MKRLTSIKRLQRYGDWEEWSDLTNTIFIDYLRSEVSKKLDDFDFDRATMLYQAIYSHFTKLDCKQAKFNRVYVDKGEKAGGKADLSHLETKQS